MPVQGQQAGRADAGPAAGEMAQTGSSRRRFLQRAGLLALAVPGASTLLEACASVVASAKASTIRVGWTIEPDTMNPLTAYSTESVEVTQLIYDQLMQYDLELKPEPGLATSWSYSPDGKTITYRLRTGVRWHDGRPFSAADAAFTFELIKSKQIGNFGQWLADMVTARAPDPATLDGTYTRTQAFNPGAACAILPGHTRGHLYPPAGVRPGAGDADPRPAHRGAHVVRADPGVPEHPGDRHRAL